MAIYFPLIAGAIAALCIVLVVWGFALVRSEQQMSNQYYAKDKSPEKSKVSPIHRISETIGTPFESIVMRWLSQKRINKIQKRIVAAGAPEGLNLQRYVRRRAGEVILYGLLGLMFIGDYTLIGLICIALGLTMSDVTLFIGARQRQDKIERSMPDFLDVLTVTVSAGLGFRNALVRVTDSMPGPLTDEIRIVLHQMELGVPRREAFEALRERNSTESISQFVTALLQAEELGAPLSQALVEISADMRRSAAQWARRKAQKTTPQVTAITAATVIPGMMVLIVGLLYFGTGASFGEIFGS